jgi:hypothetical protein
MNSQHMAGFTGTGLEGTCVVGRNYLSDSSCDDPSDSSMVGEPVVPSRREKISVRTNRCGAGVGTATLLTQGGTDVPLLKKR